MLFKNLHGGSSQTSQTFIEDVFSTYTYTGTGAARSITNGIDLSGRGGMVWFKNRSRATAGHALFDTVNGGSVFLTPSGNQGYLLATAGLSFGSGSTNITFNNNGFSLGTDTAHAVNNYYTTDDYVSWAFRKASKFFDVVTYTGNGSAQRSVSHALAQTVGMIYVKCTSHTSDWYVYYRTEGATGYLKLNSTAAANSVPDATDGEVWGNPRTAATSTIFSVGGGLNTNGRTYVAYLFAHDTSTDGLIQCGSYTGTGAGGQTITLGFEPQFLLFKCASQTNNWLVYDNVRAMDMVQNNALVPNTTGAEGVGSKNLELSSTGFKLTGNTLNDVSQTFIYMAIRRGPMRQPTSGTQVYNAISRNGTGSNATISGVGFTPDMVHVKNRVTANAHFFVDRMRGNLYLNPEGTFAEASGGTGFPTNTWDVMDGIRIGTSGAVNNYPDPIINHFFRRYPGVFDIVCYTGTGSPLTVTHNLGVVPELIISKPRNSASTYWGVYHEDLGTSVVLYFDSSTGSAPAWVSSTPTNTSISFIATTYQMLNYLFATKAGISKVGTYTGNNTSLTVDCGFSAGARFVMIKRTDSTGDWLMWDSTRGIVAGNDPHISLNTSAAELNGDDSIDPHDSGFTVNLSGLGVNANVGSATYIYLAIA